MTRNTTRVTLRAEDLVEELALGAAVRLKCNSDDIHHVVRAVVDYLVAEYRAQDFYIPAGFGPAKYPVAEIRQAVAAGESVRSVCRRFHLSRRTLYGLLEAEPQAVD